MHFVLFVLRFGPFYILEELYKKSSWKEVWFITQNAATQLGLFYGPKPQIWKATFLQWSQKNKENILDNITPIVKTIKRS